MAHQPIEIPRMDLLEGGWVQLVDPLPGWETFRVDLRADLVNGEPRITGLRLEPREGTPKRDAVLTVNRLRTFPVAALAAAVYHWTHLRPGTVGELVDALTASGEALAAQPRRKGHGPSTSAEDVATVYARARLHGEAPRAAVCAALAISSRTADRYIAEARRRGLLAPYDDRKHES